MCNVFQRTKARPGKHTDSINFSCGRLKVSKNITLISQYWHAEMIISLPLQKATFVWNINIIVHHVLRIGEGHQLLFSVEIGHFVYGISDLP